MSYPAPRETGTVTCFDCGADHEARFSHIATHGGDRIFAVVCGDYTAYYTEEVIR